MGPCTTPRGTVPQSLSWVDEESLNVYSSGREINYIGAGDSAAARS